MSFEPPRLGRVRSHSICKGRRKVWSRETRARTPLDRERRRQGSEWVLTMPGPLPSAPGASEPLSSPCPGSGVVRGGGLWGRASPVQGVTASAFAENTPWLARAWVPGTQGTKWTCVRPGGIRDLRGNEGSEDRRCPRSGEACPRSLVRGQTRRIRAELGSCVHTHLWTHLGKRAALVGPPTPPGGPTRVPGA